jgi:CheY-like chemotaxis protein
METSERHRGIRCASNRCREGRATAFVPPAVLFADAITTPERAGGVRSMKAPCTWVLELRISTPSPSIFIKGVRTSPGDRVADLLLDAGDYIIKPFDPDELLARVSRFLRRSSHIYSQSARRPRRDGERPLIRKRLRGGGRPLRQRAGTTTE